MGQPPRYRTALHEARTGKAMKIGCVVYVQLPAMLRPSGEKSPKIVRKKSDNVVPLNDLLVLFMN
jgi:hypothetical protein